MKRFIRTLVWFGLMGCPALLNAQQTAAPNAAMMEAFKLAQPSEAHKVLALMAGKWTGKLNITDPSGTQPPMESTEEADSRLMLGGRYLVGEARGTLMGMPMQRMSVLGYDNFKKIYTLVFYSSMGTATDTAVGTYDASKKTLTLRGVFDGPGGKEPFKNVVRIESDDVHVFESYKVLKDGSEVKVIEEVFMRQK